MEHEQSNPETPATDLLPLADLAEQFHSVSEPIVDMFLDANMAICTNDVLATHPEPESRVRAIQCEALSHIAVASTLALLAREAADEAVRSARAEGISWANIRRAAGLSSTAAQRRWDPVSKTNHAAYQRGRRQQEGPAQETPSRILVESAGGNSGDELVARKDPTNKALVIEAQELADEVGIPVEAILRVIEPDYFDPDFIDRNLRIVRNNPDQPEKS